MLGWRLDLAKKLGMPLPARIRVDLMERRNAVVHQGADVTSVDVNAAISAAWEAVRQYGSLPGCCHEPGRRSAPDAD